MSSFCLGDKTSCRQGPVMAREPFFKAFVVFITVCCIYHLSMFLLCLSSKSPAPPNKSSFCLELYISAKDEKGDSLLDISQFYIVHLVRIANNGSDNISNLHISKHPLSFHQLSKVITCNCLLADSFFLVQKSCRNKNVHFQVCEKLKSGVFYKVVSENVFISRTCERTCSSNYNIGRFSQNVWHKSSLSESQWFGQMIYRKPHIKKI